MELGVKEIDLCRIEVDDSGDLITSIEDARAECRRRNAEEARKPIEERMHWFVRDEGTVDNSGIMGIR